MANPPDFEAVLKAAARLAGVAHLTPVVTSHTLDQLTGCQVFLKCEHLQRSGAFKFRGAYNALAALDPAAREAGVVTYSSGNHGQAVALAGRLLGVHTRVIMPTNAPAVKREAAIGYGAEVVTYDPATEEREAVAQELAGKTGAAIVPPFNHPHVIAGQGTAALELLEQAGPLELMLAPCGGGGLLSGTALAVRGRSPGTRVMGVEPEGADNGNRAFRSGKIEVVAHPQTFADGLRPKALGELTLAVMLENVDGMVTVSEAEIRTALEFLWSRAKLLVEPSGAVGLAGLLSGRIQARGQKVGVILSGGNADIQAVARWLAGEEAGA